MKKANKQHVLSYIKEQYGVMPEYLWHKFPDYAVFRHSNNRKWFAAVMNVPAAKLGLSGEDIKEIINLKCNPLLIGSLRESEGFLPAYHMNKENWISVLLDGTVDKDEICRLIDMSYELTC